MTNFDVTQIEELLRRQEAERQETLRKTELVRRLAELGERPVVIQPPGRNPVILRPATALDFPDIKDLHNEAGGLNDGSDASLAGKLYEFHETMRSTICLARDNLNNALLGIACIDWSAHQLKTALVVNVLVATSTRRQGIAACLMQFIEILVAKFEHHQLAVMVMPTNANALSLYKKLGFVQIFDGSTWSRCPFPLNSQVQANVPPPLCVYSKMI